MQSHQTASSWLPVNTSSRVLVVMWLLSALVIASIYKGNITAMLTLPKINIPIDSIADLAAQDDLPWKLEYGGIDKLMMVKVSLMDPSASYVWLLFTCLSTDFINEIPVSLDSFHHI